MNPSGYINEINSITEDLKRRDAVSKKLREQKKIAQGRLYDYMKNNNIAEYQGIKASSIAPKPKKILKTKEEKKDDAIALFRAKGVHDPEDFYEKFIKTQKTEEISRK